MQCKRYEDFIREYQYYRTFLWKYRKAKKPFCDHYFHPKMKIHEPKVNLDRNKVDWKRIDEFYKAPLFDENLISIDYVNQGSLGDCYFMSAISRIAKQPKLVSKLFDKTANTILGNERRSINIKCGAVVIFFHAFGRRTPVLIDTLLPFHKGTSNLIFSHPSNHHVSPWFCLVEKAYAKLFGSYSSISGGIFSHSIYNIFGYQPLTKQITDLFKEEKKSKKTPFERIEEYHRQGSVISCSININKIKVPQNVFKKSGLVSNHSYLLEKSIEYKEMHFFRIRNPWGHHEWNGDWSDKSPLWTKEMKHALKVKNADDGTFYMIEKDFFNYFTNIDVSRPIPQNWHSKTFTIEMRPGRGDGCKPESPGCCLERRPNYAIKIDSKVPSNQKVSLFFLFERRSFFPDKVKFVNCQPSKFLILFVFSNGKKLSQSVINSSKRFYLASQSSIFGYRYDIQNKSDILTVAIQRLEKSDIYEECSIRVSCKFDFELFKIGNPNDLVEDNDDTGAIFNNFATVHKIVASNRHSNYIKKHNHSNHRHRNKKCQQKVHSKPNRKKFAPKIRSIKKDENKSDSEENETNNNSDDDDDDNNDYSNSYESYSDEEEDISIDLKKVENIEKEKAKMEKKEKFLQNERDEIQSNLNKLTKKALKLQKEVDQIVHDIDNEEDEEKITQMNKLAELKRNKLEETEEQANELMSKVDDKEREIARASRTIRKLDQYETEKEAENEEEAYKIDQNKGDKKLNEVKEFQSNIEKVEPDLQSDEDVKSEISKIESENIIEKDETETHSQIDESVMYKEKVEDCKNSDYKDEMENHSEKRKEKPNLNDEVKNKVKLQLSLAKPLINQPLKKKSARKIFKPIKKTI